MYWILVVFCGLLSLLNSANLHAENVKLDEIVVTATRTEVPRSQIPGSVTVMTEKDIESAQVSNVSDLLRNIPGIDVVQQGGAGKTTSIFIRGGESGHTLVLVDGIRVNSTTTGGFDFADLAVDNIERIEIIRGPLSTLYGSDAVGGVIQIFTKRAKASSASAGFEGGSYGTTRETVSTEVKKDRYDLSLAASRMDTEGFSAVKSGSERDGYQSTTLSSRIGIFQGSAAQIDMTARLSESKTELDGWNVDDPNYQQQRRWHVLGIAISSPITSVWNHKLSLSSSDDRLVGLDVDTPFNRYTIDMGIRTIDWQHNIRTNEGNQLTFGYEWQRKEGENQGNFSKAFSNQALYLQDQRGLGTPVQLLAGVRWDESTIYESAFTYRVGLSYLQTERVRWHTQYGTGFRGPSLNDLFWPGAGNPDLRAEKSNGWEVGVEQSFSDRFSLSLNYYENVFKDLIQWAPINPSDPFSLWMPQNVGRAVSSGWEGEMRWDPASFLHLTGSYVYNDTEDRENGGYLIRRPLNKYRAEMKIGGANRNLAIRFLHVGRRFDAQGNQNPLSAYSRIDMVGSYRVTGRLETFGRIENLLDREYEEAKGYGVAGFSTYGGLRMTF